MQGSLGDFDLAEVLQVVSLGRQYTGVELSLRGGHSGTIFVKSGHVVSASADERQGHDAFKNLFRSREGDFLVFRQDTPAELPEPLGRLDALLMDAVAERSNARAEKPFPDVMEQPTHPGVAPPAPGAPVPSSFPPPPAPRALPARFGSRPPTPVRSTESPRIVAFVSPKGGSGKSTLALNTSLSLARRGHSVILVDGDVNGDVLSAIDARSRAKVGALDVVAGQASIAEALIATVLPRLKLMPAVGPILPDLDLVTRDPHERWVELLGALAERAEVVVVDTPAGMFGATRAILRGVTHVVGVLQAEVLAARSFQRFSEGLATLPEGRRPAVLGVALNMLQTRHHASLGVFQDALENLPAEWLFDTTIPRHPAFLEATHDGVPLRQLDEDAPPPVAFLFDNLAGELADRLGLKRPKARARKLLE
jgi:chromosome partitioning protein